jgi:dipeptidyl aminopeptidase/acylaminoacyl peptidase
MVHRLLVVLTLLASTSLAAPPPKKQAGTTLAPQANVSAPARPHSLTVMDMLAMDRISDPRVSPDGTQVVFTVRVTDLAANRGFNNLWIAKVDGSSARALTTGQDGATQGRWAPDGASVYFVWGKSGSQQVWKADVASGATTQVTEEPLDVDSLEVAESGNELVFSMAVFPGKDPAQTKAELDAHAKQKTTAMEFDHMFVRHWDTWSDGTRNHLFAYDLAARKAVDLMPAMDADCPGKPFGGSEDFSISRDGMAVAFSAKDAGREEAWSTNYDIYFVLTNGTMSPKKLVARPAWDAQPRLSPDLTRLAYLAMTRPGFEADRYEIVVRNLESGAEKSFTLRADSTPTGDRSPSDLIWSRDGKELYCTADHLGQHSLFAVDPGTGKARIVVEKGTVGNPQPLPGGRILFGMNSLLGPNELYAVASDGSDPRRVTTLNDARLAVVRMGRPEQFSFIGAKGDLTYGYLVTPAEFDASKKYPVAFLIHGGPQGSFGNDFHYRWNPQAYAGAGYAAVMVDFHGSTGYGQAFTDAISDDWGGAPLEDLKLGLDAALRKYPFLDGSRIGALGASYGGFMVNWIAGAWPDRFRCLVAHDGNLDERNAYYDTEELWFPEWEHGGTPWDNPAGYTKHNPIELVKNWKTPMLVIHGQKDFRIPYTQGLSTFTALQRKGIPSKLVIFPDENHWVLKPANSIKWHETVLAWLDSWLKK